MDQSKLTQDSNVPPIIAPQYHQILTPFEDLLQASLAYPPRVPQPLDTATGLSNHARKVIKYHPYSELAATCAELDLHPLTRKLTDSQYTFLSTAASKKIPLNLGTKEDAARFTLSSDILDGAKGSVDVVSQGNFLGHLRIMPQTAGPGVDILASIAPTERLVITTRLGQMNSRGAGQIAVRGDAVLPEGVSVSATAFLRPPWLLGMDQIQIRDDPVIQTTSHVLDTLPTGKSADPNQSETYQATLLGLLTQNTVGIAHSISEYFASSRQRRPLQVLQKPAGSHLGGHASLARSVADLGRSAEELHEIPSRSSISGNLGPTALAEDDLQAFDKPAFVVSATKVVPTWGINIGASLAGVPQADRSSHLGSVNQTSTEKPFNNLRSSLNVLVSSGSSSSSPSSRGALSDKSFGDDSKGGKTNPVLSLAWGMYALSRAYALTAVSIAGKVVSDTMLTQKSDATTPEQQAKVEKIGEVANAISSRAAQAAAVASSVAQDTLSQSVSSFSETNAASDDSLPPWIPRYQSVLSAVSDAAEQAVNRISNLPEKTTDIQSSSPVLDSRYSWAVELSDWARHASFFGAVTVASPSSSQRSRSRTNNTGLRGVPDGYPKLSLGIGLHSTLESPRNKPVYPNATDEDYNPLPNGSGTQHQSNLSSQDSSSSTIADRLLGLLGMRSKTETRPSQTNSLMENVIAINSSQENQDSSLPGAHSTEAVLSAQLVLTPETSVGAALSSTGLTTFAVQTRTTEVGSVSVPLSVKLKCKGHTYGEPVGQGVNISLDLGIGDT